MVEFSNRKRLDLIMCLKIWRLCRHYMDIGRFNINKSGCVCIETMSMWVTNIEHVTYRSAPRCNILLCVVSQTCHLSSYVLHIFCTLYGCIMMSGVEFGTKVYTKSILGCRVSYKTLHKVYTKSTQSLHKVYTLRKVYTKSTQSLFVPPKVDFV